MQEIKCLDHGFVRLIDHMGDDRAVVQAARTSYGDGTKSVTKDRGLIRYLIRHRHTSPFEMVTFKFHCKMPIFVARQWIRHRTASVNEVSSRYSVLPPEQYSPLKEDIQFQSEINNQGRSKEKLPTELISNTQVALDEAFKKCNEVYRDLIDKNIAREIARICLPVSQYTEWYWKMDLHNLMHFLALRLDHHSQMEIRVFAEAIKNIIKPIVPITLEAFEDYTLNAHTFSGPEMNLLKNLLKDTHNTIPNESNKMSNREIRELKEVFSTNQ